MTKAHHLNEAMQWLKGALNCYSAAKIDGQSFIASYVPRQICDVKYHLAQAKLLRAPKLP